MRLALGLLHDTEHISRTIEMRPLGGGNARRTVSDGGGCWRVVVVGCFPQKDG